MTVTSDRLRRLRPRRKSLLVGGAVLYVEAMLVGGYVLFADVTVTDPRLLLYPWLWINASLLAVATTSVQPSTGRRRHVALGIAVAYFCLLAAAGGLATLGYAFHGQEHAAGFRLAWPLPPGWGPAVFYGGYWISLAVIPYQVVGYATLAFLVYVTVLDTAGSALAGVVGLFSCVSCAWPLVGTLLAGVLGGGSAVASVASSQPYGVSTLVFLSAIVLLSYRPTFGR